MVLAWLIAQVKEPTVLLGPQAASVTVNVAAEAGARAALGRPSGKRAISSRRRDIRLMDCGWTGDAKSGQEQSREGDAMMPLNVLACSNKAP